MYQASKNYLEDKEKVLFAEFIKEQEELDKKLSAEYNEYTSVMIVTFVKTKIQIHHQIIQISHGRHTKTPK